MRAIRSAVGAAFLAAAAAPLLGAQTISAHPALAAACGLLSRADVAEAVAPVGEGLPRTLGRDVTSCLFAAERGGQVTLLVHRIPPGAWMFEQIERMKRGVQLGTYREVHGIGDRSFLYLPQSEAGVLCVFHGGYYLQVSMLRMARAVRRPAALESLAIRALARLSGGTAEIDSR